MTVTGSTPGEAQHEKRREFLARHGPGMTGTRITFIPDKTIFETTEFDYDILAHRLRELAFLNAGLAILISMNGPVTMPPTVTREGWPSSSIT